MPGNDAFFVAEEAGPVKDHTGRTSLIASRSFADVVSPDVVVVPGTLGGNEHDEAVVAWLRRVHPGTQWTTSACTGSITLAAAGILDGLDATTHWARRDHLEEHGARYSEQRVVEHGKVITAAGFSSGIDMALTLVARMYGPTWRRWPSSASKMTRNRLSTPCPLEGPPRDRRICQGDNRRPIHTRLTEVDGRKTVLSSAESAPYAPRLTRTQALERRKATSARREGDAEVIELAREGRAQPR